MFCDDRDHSGTKNRWLLPLPPHRRPSPVLLHHVDSTAAKGVPSSTLQLPTPPLSAFSVPPPLHLLPLPLTLKHRDVSPPHTHISVSPFSQLSRHPHLVHNTGKMCFAIRVLQVLTSGTLLYALFSVLGRPLTGPVWWGRPGRAHNPSWCDHLVSGRVGAFCEDRWEREG